MAVRQRVLGVRGVREVARNLSTLAGRTQKKILRKVVRKVQKPMVGTARQTVRRRSGQLAKSLGTVVRTYKLSVWAVLGARHGFRAEWEGKPIDPTKYAHLLERRYPFLRPAFKQNEETAKTSAVTEIAREIEREAERQANKL